MLRDAASGQLKPLRIERTLQVLEQQTRRLARLVDQLLGVSRIQAGRLQLSYETTDIVALVESTVLAARVRLSEPRTITVRRPDGRLLGTVEPIRIQQVLDN